MPLAVLARTPAHYLGAALALGANLAGKRPCRRLFHFLEYLVVVDACVRRVHQLEEGGTVGRLPFAVVGAVALRMAFYSVGASVYLFY